MKKTIKHPIQQRIGLILMLLAMVFPFSTRAIDWPESNSIIGGVYYAVTNVPDRDPSEVGDPEDPRLSISKLIVGPDVTRIGSYTFVGSVLTQIDLSYASSLETIGEGAFSGAYLMTKVTLCENSPLTTIGNAAFKGCKKLANFNYENAINLETIGNEAFASCAFTKLDLSNSKLVRIGDSAFYNNTGLLTVVLPPTVTTMGKSAFEACTSLANINLGDLTNLGAIEEYTFYSNNLGTITIPASVTTIGQSAFSTSWIKHLYFAENSSLKTIGPYAFRKIGTTSVVLPASVESIGYRAFDESEIASIKLEEGSKLTSLDKGVFYACKYLKTAELAAEITEIPDELFMNCWALRTFEIPSTVTSIGNRAFDHCTALESINLPTGLKTIGLEAFRNCNKCTSVNIPSGVTTIGKQAFYECRGLLSAKVPESVTDMGEGVFRCCMNLASVECEVSDIPAHTFNMVDTCDSYMGSKLKSVTLKNTQTIGEGAFCTCNVLPKLELPSTVKTIGAKAFYKCRKLPFIELPASVTSIGEEAFYECDVLTTINCNAVAVPTLGAQDNTITKTIYVPGASVEAYKADANWAAFGTIVARPVEYEGIFYQLDAENHTAAVTYDVASYSYNENKYPVETLTIPSIIVIDEVEYTVTAIKSQTFYGCTSLTTITLPSTLQTIGDEAFYDCYITQINLGSEITSIGRAAFRNCSYLGKVIIDALTPPEIVPISDSSNSTFPTTTYSYSVWVPNAAYDTYMANENWSQLPLKTPALTVDGICYSLDEANHKATVIANERDGYKGDIVIPEFIEIEKIRYDVISIEAETFLDCEEVTSISFPYVTSIGNQAFSGTGIKAVDFSGVTDFGVRICLGCKNLTTVTLPETTMLRIPDGMFAQCVSLRDITIPESVETIGEASFNGTGLEAVLIPKYVRTLEERCFNGCLNLALVHFPTSLRTIGSYAFYYDKNLKTISWYDSEDTEVIPATPVGNAIITKSVASNPGDFTYHITTIGEYAFSGTAMTDFYIPQTVETDGLTIGDYCFSETAIARLDVVATTLPQLSEYGFDYETYETALVFVPEAQLEAYKADAAWGKFKGYPLSNESQMYIFANEEETQVYYAGEKSGDATGSYIVPDEVTDGVNTYKVVAVSACAFKGTDVKTVNLPPTVVSIGNSAFEGCTALESVSYRTDAQPTVYIVGKSQIRKYLETSIDEPIAVEAALGKNAFDGCTGLTSVALPDGITEIPQNAFRNCTSLTAIEIPSTVGNLGEAAFMGSGLTSVTVPENIYYLPSQVFKNCASLSDITLPEYLNEIGQQACMGCTSLKTITLPANVYALGTEAFAGVDFVTVISLNTYYPWMYDSNAFSEATYNNATLIVPQGSESYYRSDQNWSLFKNILSTSGIEDIIADGDADNEAEYYNLQGIRVTKPSSGIFIRRHGNKLEKVIIP